MKRICNCNILGLGETLQHYKPNKNDITIGVNETASLYKCDYTVVINHRNEFLRQRYSNLLKPIKQPTLITHKESIAKDLGGYYKDAKVIEMEHLLNNKGVIKPNASIDNDKFYHSQTSPFVACVYALKFLKPSVISLHGVDFQTHKAIGQGKNIRHNREMICWEWIIKECIRLDIEIEVSEFSHISKIINRLNITSYENI